MISFRFQWHSSIQLIVILNFHLYIMYMYIIRLVCLRTIRHMYCNVYRCYTASNNVGVWTKYWWFEIIPTECHKEQNSILVNSSMIIPIGFKNRQIERTTDVEKVTHRTPLPTHGRGHFIYTGIQTCRCPEWISFFLFISLRYIIGSEILHFHLTSIYQWVGIFRLWHIIWSYF